MVSSNSPADRPASRRIPLAISQNFDNSAPPRTRKESAAEIDRALARFPLVVRILGELRQTQVPCSGDDDIRHGCERALTAILGDLARIAPAPPGSPAINEEAVRAMLANPAARGLIDADKLQRMQLFIDCILHAPRHS